MVVGGGEGVKYTVPLLNTRMSNDLIVAVRVQIQFRSSLVVCNEPIRTETDWSPVREIPFQMPANGSRVNNSSYF